MVNDMPELTDIQRAGLPNMPLPERSDTPSYYDAARAFQEEAERRLKEVNMAAYRPTVAPINPDGYLTSNPIDAVLNSSTSPDVKARENKKKLDDLLTKIRTDSANTYFGNQGTFSPAIQQNAARDEAQYGALGAPINVEGSKMYDFVGDMALAKYDTYTPGLNNAEAAARNQSTWNKWRNGLGKLVAKTALYGVGGVANMLYGGAAAISQMRLASLYDNSFNDYLNELDEYINHALPNYYSEEENNMNFLQKMGTANFWANDVIGSGLSFTTGAFLSAYLTGGIGLLGTTSAAIRGAAARGLFAMASKGAAQTAKNLFKPVLRNMVKKANKVNSTRVATSLMFGSAWEASVEANQVYKQNEQDFRDYYKTIYNREPDGKEMEDFRKLNRNVSNGVFAANMAIVGLSNFLQFGKYMGIGSGFLDKTFTRPANFLKRGFDRKIFGLGTVKAKDGTLEVIKGNLAQRVAANTWYMAKPALTEGFFEEGLQGVASRAADDYVKSHYDKTSLTETVDFMDSFSKGFLEAYTTKEGLMEVGIGAIIGGAMNFRNRFGFGERGRRADALSETVKMYNENNVFNRENVMNIIQNTARLNSISNEAGGDIISGTQSSSAEYNSFAISNSLGMLDSHAADFRNMVESLDNAEIVRDVDGINTEKEAEAYKKAIIADYNSKLKMYKEADEFGRRITDGTKYGKYADYVGQVYYNGLSAESRIEDISEAIGKLMGNESYADALNALSALKRETLERASNLIKMRAEIARLDEEVAKIGTVPDRVNEEGVDTKIEEIRKKTEELERMRAKYNAGLEQLAATSAEDFNYSEFMKSKDELLSPSPLTAEQVLEAYDSLNAIDSYIKGKQESATDMDKAVLSLIQEYRNSVTDYKNIRNLVSAFADKRFAMQHLGFLDKKVKDAVKNEGLDFGDRTVSPETASIDDDIDKALADGKISEEDAYTAKVFNHLRDRISSSENSSIRNESPITWDMVFGLGDVNAGIEYVSDKVMQHGTSSLSDIENSFYRANKAQIDAAINVNRTSTSQRLKKLRERVNKHLSKEALSDPYNNAIVLIKSYMSDENKALFDDLADRYRKAYKENDTDTMRAVADALDAMSLQVADVKASEWVKASIDSQNRAAAEEAAADNTVPEDNSGRGRKEKSSGVQVEKAPAVQPVTEEMLDLPFPEDVNGLPIIPVIDMAAPEGSTLPVLPQREEAPAYTSPRALPPGRSPLALPPARQPEAGSEREPVVLPPPGIQLSLDFGEDVRQVQNPQPSSAAPQERSTRGDTQQGEQLTLDFAEDEQIAPEVPATPVEPSITPAEAALASTNVPSEEEKKVFATRVEEPVEVSRTKVNIRFVGDPHYVMSKSVGGVIAFSGNFRIKEMKDLLNDQNPVVLNNDDGTKSYTFYNGLTVYEYEDGTLHMFLHEQDGDEDIDNRAIMRSLGFDISQNETWQPVTVIQNEDGSDKTPLMVNDEFTDAIDTTILDILNKGDEVVLRIDYSDLYNAGLRNSIPEGEEGNPSHPAVEEFDRMARVGIYFELGGEYHLVGYLPSNQTGEINAIRARLHQPLVGNANSVLEVGRGTINFTTPGFTIPVTPRVLSARDCENIADIGYYEKGVVYLKDYKKPINKRKKKGEEVEPNAPHLKYLSLPKGGVFPVVAIKTNNDDLWLYPLQPNSTLNGETDPRRWMAMGESASDIINKYILEQREDNALWIDIDMGKGNSGFHGTTFGVEAEIETVSTDELPDTVLNAESVEKPTAPVVEEVKAEPAANNNVEEAPTLAPVTFTGNDGIIHDAIPMDVFKERWLNNDEGVEDDLEYYINTFEANGPAYEGQTTRSTLESMRQEMDKRIRAGRNNEDEKKFGTFYRLIRSLVQNRLDRLQSEKSAPVPAEPQHPAETIEPVAAPSTERLSAANDGFVIDENWYDRPSNKRGANSELNRLKATEPFNFLDWLAREINDGLMFMSQPKEKGVKRTAKERRELREKTAGNTLSSLFKGEDVSSKAISRLTKENGIPVNKYFRFLQEKAKTSNIVSAYLEGRTEAEAIEDLKSILKMAGFSRSNLINYSISYFNMRDGIGNKMKYRQTSLSDEEMDSLVKEMNGILLPQPEAAQVAEAVTVNDMANDIKEIANNPTPENINKLVEKVGSLEKAVEILKKAAILMDQMKQSSSKEKKAVEKSEEMLSESKDTQKEKEEPETPSEAGQEQAAEPEAKEDINTQNNNSKDGRENKNVNIPNSGNGVPLGQAGGTTEPVGGNDAEVGGHEEQVRSEKGNGRFEYTLVDFSPADRAGELVIGSESGKKVDTVVATGFMMSNNPDAYKKISEGYGNVRGIESRGSVADNVPRPGETRQELRSRDFVEFGNPTTSNWVYSKAGSVYNFFNIETGEMFALTASAQISPLGLINDRNKASLMLAQAGRLYTINKISIPLKKKVKKINFKDSKKEENEEC